MYNGFTLAGNCTFRPPPFLDTALKGHDGMIYATDWLLVGWSALMSLFWPSP
jgi:hypothetical protein